MARPEKCPCGSGLWPEALHDGYGIFMAYACERCKATTLSKFRPDIFQQYDTDGAQIEDDY